MAANTGRDFRLHKLTGDAGCESTTAGPDDRASSTVSGALP
jgi:hypothetical protein